MLPALPDDEVEARVEHRMRRQTVFDRDEPPEFEAVVHEAALRMRVGGRKVARRQLEHLLETSERFQVTLRVIPFASEEFVEVTQTVLYAGGSCPSSMPCTSTHPSGRVSDAAADLNKYRIQLDFAQRVSMEPEESRSLIHHIARDL
ncbi:DUF5753 domain-containing protein [Streptomyces sp. M10(2022)]